MKRTLFALTTLLTLNVFAQDNPTELAKPIVDEGKRLYRSEMASWYGTDLFLEKHKDQSSIGGYFSYIKDGAPTCLFYSRKDNPKVIGTISFDTSYDLPKAKVDLAERDFSSTEAIIYALRTRAWQLIEKDSFFRRYENTHFNLIPLVQNGKRKVYVLTGARENGVVMIGNDYLLTFDMEDALLEKKTPASKPNPYPLWRKRGGRKAGSVDYAFAFTGNRRFHYGNGYLHAHALRQIC